MSEVIKSKLVDYFRHLVLSYGNTAFAPVGSIILYSGPNKDLLKVADISGAEANYNQARANRNAAILNAHTIDKTTIGELLFDKSKLNIYETFLSLSPDNGIDYADAVNFEVSRMFTQQAEGRVYTAVCGASKDRVFYKGEFPDLIAASAVTHINGYEADRFRRLYDENPDRAFNHICQSEQRLMFAIAQNLGTFEAFMEMAERRDMRRVGRRGLRDENGALIVNQVLSGVSKADRERFAGLKLEMLAKCRADKPNFVWKPNLLQGTKLG